MKNINKILISLFLVFVFITNVNAGVDPNECNISISETGISSAGFDVVMPICKTKEQDGFLEVGSRKSSYSAAWAQGLEVVDSFYNTETADGKDIIAVHGKIPVCNDSKRQVRAIGSCKTVTKSAGSCSELGKANACNWYPYDCGCGNWNQAQQKYLTWHPEYVYCTSGYSYNQTSGKCEKDGGYSINQITTSDISLKSSCETATGASCSGCKVKYALECPAYKCKTENIQISACTPDFKIGNEAAYCINPTLKFSGKFKQDTEFDVRKCANSYVTEDCGYANILIEGAFHSEGGGISNDAMNLALRLWSYHTNGSNASGFADTKTGIANRSASDCQTSTYFMKDNSGKRPNVYVNTYKYIMQTNKTNYFEVAQSILNSNGYLPTYLSNPETNRNKFNGSTFKAIDCNKNDKGKVGVVCGGNSTYRVAFELFFNTMIGNKYMMEHLDKLYSKEGKWVEVTGSDLIDMNGWTTIVIKYDREDFERVFSEVEDIPCDENNPIYKKYKSQIEPYCKTKITYYDDTGKQIGEGEQLPDGCKKGVGCYKKVYKGAICRKYTDGYRIRSVQITTTKTPSSYSVRKYVACGNTKGEQTMMAYFREPGKTTEKEEPLKDITEYTYGYKCEDGCTNTSLRMDGNFNTCSTTSDYSVKVAEPSLTCMVNASNQSDKTVYDLSDEFNVNTNFCRIYCSNVVKYTLPGKKTSTSEIDSGRYFQYKVSEDFKGSNKDKDGDTRLFSVVVKQTRSCVSEIYLTSLPINVDWKKLYGLTNNEYNDLKSNMTWTKLYHILSAKSAQQHNRKEVLNQLVYDLYNCNLYNLSKPSKYGLYKPGDYKVDYALEAIKKKYTKKSGDKYVENGLEQSYSDYVYYEGGPKIVTYVDGNETPISDSAKVGNSSNPVVNGYVTYNSLVSNLNSGKSLEKSLNLRYCYANECLKYDPNNEDYGYKANFKSENKTGSIGSYKYPLSRYVVFEIETQAGFYNGTQYQVVPNTGNVVKVPESGEGKNSKLITLHKYSYPVDVYAKNECKNGICNVKQNVGIKTFFRSTTEFRNKVQEIKQNGFRCTVEVGKPKTKDPNANYRNVDAAKLFPLSTDGSPSANSNWASVEGTAAQQQIESTADLITSGDELIEYRITLNPTQIKNLKAYNKTAGSYLNEKIYDCELAVASDGGEYYKNCKSYFLTKLKNDSSEHDNGQYANVDLNYFDGISKYSKKNK